MSEIATSVNEIPKELSEPSLKQLLYHRISSYIGLVSPWNIHTSEYNDSEFENIIWDKVELLIKEYRSL